MCDRYGIPLNMILHRIETSGEMNEGLNKKIRLDIEMVRNAVSAQILYLPTYRRIERELSSIFKGMDPDDLRRQRVLVQPHEFDEGFIELVEFGMKDVQNAVDRELAKLKEFARENLNSLTLRYLGDVVNQEYQNVGMNEIANVSDASIHSVLDSVDESNLTKSQKDNLFQVISSSRYNNPQDDHSKILSHYFLKLLKFQESMQKIERPISAFCDLCSEYAVDKQFEYNRADFSFSIIPKDNDRWTRLEAIKDQYEIRKCEIHNRSKNPSSHSWDLYNTSQTRPDKLEETIKLSDLSSGEKQIVSLFSHLYLSGQQSYFVIIDEPELSLSVTWQRRFLADIHKGNFCAGLIAATHSPFIYENELHRYAHSLDEFVSVWISELCI